MWPLLIPESLFLGEFQRKAGAVRQEGLDYFPPLTPRTPPRYEAGLEELVRQQPLLLAGGCSYWDEGVCRAFSLLLPRAPAGFPTMSLPQVCLSAEQFCGTGIRLQPGFATWLVYESRG